MSEKYSVLNEAEAFYHEGSEVGILTIHGFTGSTQSMRPLFTAYANAGYTVCAPRLKGHGTHYMDMEQSTYKDWIDSVEEGMGWLKEHCTSIFITGLSMGGTLTLYLAEKYEDIRGIIPVNAAVDVPAMADAKGLTEPRFLDAIGSDIKAEAVTELAYEKTPMKSIQEIVALMELVKTGLHKIKCPALIFVSTEDHVVPPDNSLTIRDEIASPQKKMIELSNSYHVVTLDNDKEIIIEETLNFIKQHV